MRYCLRCDAAYELDQNPCPTCNRHTIGEEERDLIRLIEQEKIQEKMVPVHVFDGVADRAILTDIFENEGIHYAIHGQAGGFGTLFTPQDGWGVLMVGESFRDRALELLAEYESQAI